MADKKKMTSRKFPGGYEGIALTTTNESIQEELFMPADGRLIAVNQQGNDPELGTIVCDLKDQEIDPDRAARLQAIMRVVKYPLGNDNCGIGLQIGPSGLKDSMSFIVDRREGEGGVGVAIAQASKFEKGPFHCGTGKCRHKIGDDDDGNPISPLHLWTGMLVWRNDDEDGPFRFEGAYPEVQADGPFCIPVHLSWDAKRQDWAWWTTSHLHPIPTGLEPLTPVPIGGHVPTPIPEPIPTPAPGLRPIKRPDRIPAPTPAGGEEPIEEKPPPPPPSGMITTPPTTPSGPKTGEKTPQEEMLENLNRMHRRYGLDVGEPPAYNTITMAGQTELPHLSTMVSMANPSLLSRPMSSDRKKLGYNNYPKVTPAQVQQYASTPICGQMCAFGAQGGPIGGGTPSYNTQQLGASGDPWRFTQKPDGSSKFTEGTASGGWVILPPEVNLTDTESGFSPEGITRSTVYFLVGPGAWFGAGQPEFSNGSIMDGYSWGWDSATGDLLFRTHVSSSAPVSAIKFDLATQNIAWRSGESYYGILEHSNTAERTYTFPDASGTLTFGGGAGIANRVAYWSDANTLAPNAALTSTHVLYADGSGLPTGDANLTWAANNLLVTGTAQITRLGLGAAAHASAVLNVAGDMIYTAGNQWYPSANSVTALQFAQADGTTAILDIDTTNKRCGFGGQVHPDAPVDSLHATLPQLRLTQTDGTVYVDQQVSAASLLTWTSPSGTMASLSATGRLTLVESMTIPGTSNSTTGVIYKSTVRFLHNFGLAGTDGYNTFLGLYSGNFTLAGSVGSQGSSNSGFGYNTLGVLTTGYNNTVVGRGAGKSITSGNNNTAFGVTALDATTDGYSNSVFGSSGLYSVSSGYCNSGLGGAVLADVTLGIYNSAIGYNTGRGITTGDYNTILGAQVTGLAADLQHTIILADGAGLKQVWIDRLAGFVWNTGHGDYDYRVSGDTCFYHIFAESNAASENIALLTTAAPGWNTGDRIVFWGERETAPTGNPTAGFYAWGDDASGAGTCAPYFRTEDGKIINLYQSAHIADPAGGATVDTEARSAVNSILAALEARGFLAAA